MSGKRVQSNKRILCQRKILIFLCVILGAELLILIAYNFLKEEPAISESTPVPPKESITLLENEDTSIEDTSPSYIQNIGDVARKDKCYTFLLAASDQASGNADTIMVITFDTIQSKVGVVSIPRDTLINPKDGFSTYPKINSTYLQGIDNLVGAVSNLLGIPIDFYITIDINGFVKLIDTVGGIDFNIPVHMSYDDPIQNLSIHFEPGVQHLNGMDALKVCRLRSNDDGTLAYPDYDIGRTRTQQQILIAVAKKMLLNPHKITEYLRIFQEYVKTNLGFGNAVWFVDPFLKLDLDKDVSFSALPGDGTISYKNARYCYELFPEETVAIVNDLISPYSTPISLEDMNIFVTNK